VSLPGRTRRNHDFFDLDAQLPQFTVDARSAPQRVGRMHLPDETPDVDGHCRRARPSRGRLPSPVERDRDAGASAPGVGGRRVDGRGRESPPRAQGVTERYSGGWRTGRQAARSC
jgi:hypothetical protein